MKIELLKVQLDFWGVKKRRGGERNLPVQFIEPNPMDMFFVQ
jgi:hypothetical protein